MRVSSGDRHGHTEAHREGDVKIEAEAAVMQLKPRDDLNQQAGRGKERFSLRLLGRSTMALMTP